MTKIKERDGRIWTLEETLVWCRTHFINPNNPKHTICGHDITKGRFRNNTTKQEDVTCRGCLNNIKQRKKHPPKRQILKNHRSAFESYINCFFMYLENEYICLICGEVVSYSAWYKHISNTHSEWTNAFWVSVGKITRSPMCGIPSDYIEPEKTRHNLKPWKDPESLFCDTAFLKNEMGIDVRLGDECKDDNIKNDV